MGKCRYFCLDYILGYCYEINNNIPLYMENIFSDKWKYGTDENQVGHGVKPEVRL